MLDKFTLSFQDIYSGCCAPVPGLLTCSLQLQLLLLSWMRCNLMIGQIGQQAFKQHSYSASPMDVKKW